MATKKDSIRLKAEAYYIENMEASQKEVAALYKVTELTVAAGFKNTTGRKNA